MDIEYPFATGMRKGEARYLHPLDFSFLKKLKPI
jgi:hypothetical protein